MRISYRDPDTDEKYILELHKYVDEDRGRVKGYEYSELENIRVSVKDILDKEVYI